MGKVHGSLTRAGKVRGQTPKQPKADRIGKRVTAGRAKRRLLYIRRFVNPKVGPNGKRLYNSHSL